MNVDRNLEDLMGHLGDFGKYQMQQFLLLSLGALSAGLHLLTSVTVAAVPKHRCAIPGAETDSHQLDWNSTAVLSWIPRTKDGLSSCELYNRQRNITYKCHDWVYDHTYYKSSRGMEWDMVCDRRWMGAIGQMLYMLGAFTGALVLGSLADKYGRKKIFCISGVGQLIVGTSVAYVNNYPAYAALTYIYGIVGCAGTFMTGCVLALEIIGASRRTVCGMALQIFFVFGECLVAFWGWIIKDKTWLQTIHGLHGLLFIGHWWLIDESPRWLWANGRKEEAVDIVEKGMKINNPHATLDRSRFLNKEQKEKDIEEIRSSVGILDVFKTPQLRKRALICCFNWGAVSLGYYGLSLGTNKMAGNPYVTLFIMAFIEVPSDLLVILCMDKTGRRSMNVTFLLVGCFSLFVAALLPKSTTFLSTLVTYIVYVGKFCVAGSFSLMYNYTVELYPTVLRNTGVGLGNMCARLCASLTPLIALLDSYDERVPMLVFAVILLISGHLSMLLPETLNQPMPQTVEDGENFQVGDTCCTTGCCPIGRKRKPALALNETGIKLSI